jgi:hypothetical protein
MKRPRPFRLQPWPETLAALAFVLLVAGFLVWSGLAQIGVPPQ